MTFLRKWVVMTPEQFKVFSTYIQEYWQPTLLEEMAKLWQAFHDAQGADFALSLDLAKHLPLAALHNIARCYEIDDWDDRFNWDRDLVDNKFIPMPDLPTLYAKNKELHYLWFSHELEPVMIMLWLHLRYDRNKFCTIVQTVWASYAQKTKSEEGYAGSVERFKLQILATAKANS
jgi:hypothetical protein